MRIRCKTNEIDSIKTSDQLKKYLVSVRGDRGKIEIEPGTEFVVYALLFSDGIAWFAICDYPGSTFPNWFPEPFFEVTDNRITRHWRFKNLRHSELPDPLLAPECWVGSDSFEDRLFEFETAATAQFEEAKFQMDMEFKNPLIMQGTAVLLGEDWVECSRCNEVSKNTSVNEMIVCDKCKAILSVAVNNKGS